jgi:hypothetical protein
MGKPQNGKNGIGNMITSQIPTSKSSIFHLCLSLEPSILLLGLYIDKLIKNCFWYNFVKLIIIPINSQFEDV